MKLERKVKSARHDRGFLLLVIIGVLALMLTVCIGFISMTRGELQGVITIRDRADGLDVARSAVDWNIGIISQDLFGGGGQFKDSDPSAIVSNARTTGYKWWYRPYERGLKDLVGAGPPAQTWPIYKNPWWGTMQGMTAPSPGYPYFYSDPTRTTPLPDCVDPAGKDQAEWTWLPPDHFPNNTRGRFMTLIWDPNSLPCLNDWLEDCNPTQTQMAHMIRDGYGEQFIERAREWRDGGSNTRGGTYVVGAGNVTGGIAQPHRVPLRYQEAWRMATRTLRYMHWNSGHGWGHNQPYGGIHRYISPNWVTTNTTYFSGFAAEMYALKSGLVADGIILNKTYPRQNLGGVGGKYMPPTPYEGFAVNQPWWDWRLAGQPNKVQPDTHDTKWAQSFLPVGMPFSTRAYVDPDTGRAPVNVNSTYNSGERLPQNVFNGTPVFTMEAVFNVDSLKRIIRLNTFYFDADLDGAYSAVEQITAADLEEFFTDPLNADADIDNDTVFTATNTPEWPPVGLLPVAATEAERIRAKKALANLALIKQDELLTKLAYQYQETLCRYFTATYRHPMKRKYPPFYNTAVQPTEDFSDPGNYETVYGAGNGLQFHCKKYDYSETRFPVPLDGPDDNSNFRHQVYSDFVKISNGSASVSFDTSDNPNVSQGKIDNWTIAACYDNIVPGKPPQTRNFGFAWGANDPLTILWLEKRGRDESGEDLEESGFTPNDTNPTWAPLQAWLSDVDPAKQPSAAQKDLILRYSRGVYGHHSDDPALKDSGNSSFTIDDPVNIKQDAARFLNLRPKGADIRGLGNVPWRQLVFGPDWFSTELTTTTTTFVMIVTAQLIDAESIAIDPTRPRDFFSGQWGFCVELAPDVRVETDDTYDGNAWPTPANARDIGLGFYCGTNTSVTPNMRWPEFMKKARTTDDPNQTPQGSIVVNSKQSWFYSMDSKCSTLKTQHGWQYGINKTGKYDWSDPLETIPTNITNRARTAAEVDSVYNRWGDPNKSPDTWFDPNWGRCYQWESAARNWNDFRGVRKDDHDAYYKGASQNTKRVVIRGVWSHNQGTNK